MTKPNPKLAAVTNKVEDIKLVMHENIEKATQNCVKLESIHEKSEELMVEAGVFQTNARKLKDKIWWKNMKMRFIVGSIAIIGIIMIVCMVYYNTRPTTAS